MSGAPMSFAPQPARAHDLTTALELLQRLGLPQEGVVEHFGLYHVVRDDGRVIGLAGLEACEPDALLRSVGVDPSYRGQGLAGSLVTASLDLARKMNLRAIYLLTTTARGYFLRQGFADCSRGEAPPAIRESWEFREGCPSTSAFMRREVGPAA
jgi:amino-acid N-acetyltransferase